VVKKLYSFLDLKKMKTDRFLNLKYYKRVSNQKIYYDTLIYAIHEGPWPKIRLENRETVSAYLS